MPLPELKDTVYTFIFDGRKRCTSCPKEGEGEGGEVIWAMPERKHSFLKEVFPYSERIGGASLLDCMTPPVHYWVALHPCHDTASFNSVFKCDSISTNTHAHK